MEILGERHDQREVVGAALREPQRAPASTPHRSVKTTLGGDSHSALRRFTPAFLLIRRRGNVLRPGDQPARCRTGRYGRGWSDPPVRGPGTA